MAASVYVHLGDSEHRPMVTIAVSSASELRARAKEARATKWPIRFQIDTEIVSQRAAEQHLARRRR